MRLVSAGLSSLAMSWLPALICALLAGGALGRFLSDRPHDRETIPPVKYVITGEKDATGHWTEKVKMEHGEEDWHMEIDHMTLDVGQGQPKVKVTATFSAKSKTHDVAVVPEVSSESAESGIAEVSGVVFQLFPRSYVDWYGAERRCREWGGHLAVPDTRDKMRHLTAILRKHVRDIGETTGAFLGFQDLEREGHFVTVLDKPLFDPQSSWSPHWFEAGQPDNDKAWSELGENCGSMRPNGGLNDVPCLYNLPYICEKSAEKAVDEAGASNSVDGVEKAVDEAEASNSAADGDEDDDSLRLFRYNHVNWFEARLACIEWGGHLAIPDSEAKLLKMTNMLAATSTDEKLSAFVGFNDMKKEGHFVTIFGEPVFDQSASWNPYWFNEAQPDDDKGWTTEGEDCGSVRPEGGINDVPCAYHLPYFCEKSSRVDDFRAPASGSDVSEQSGEAQGDPPLRLFERHDLDWAGAEEACKAWGGHLAIPDSSLKLEMMTLNMKLWKVPAAFLGFGDQEQEGHFVTIFGKPVFSQSWSPPWWREDQPDDDKSWFPDGEDCGSVRSSGGLNDVPCKHRMPFFCEKTLAPHTSDEQTLAPHTSDEQTLAPHTSDEQTQDGFVEASEESSTVAESSLVITDMPSTDSPTAVQTNVEEDEVSSSSSTEQAVSQVVTSFPDLDTPDDSPVDAQSSEEEEESSSLSMEEALWREFNSIQNLSSEIK